MSTISCIRQSVHSLVATLRRACAKKKMRAMQSEKDKDEIAYMVEYAKQLDSYKMSLIADHEPCEVDQLVKVYDEQARVKAKLFLYYSKIGTNARVFDKLPYDRQETQVVKAANILHELGKMDSIERARFIKSFIVQYGDIHKLNAKLLQASIVNDADLVGELEKIYKD